VIPGDISTKDFSTVVGINEELAKNILDNFIENGIGDKNNDLFHFKESDKLRSSLLAIKNGVPIEDVSTLLNWQDFETLTLEILDSLDFRCSKNFFLKKPRMEIDVIGIKFGMAILIDCKHWKRLSNSSLQNSVKKQIERTKHYLKNSKIKMAIPAIVTLHQEGVTIINGTPIIPIFQFRSFLEDFYGNTDGLKIIKA